MSDSHTTATPETTNPAPTTHPLVRENQRAIEAEVEQSAIAGQRVMREIGGGSPSASPDRLAGTLGQMQSASGQTGMLRQLQRGYGNSYVGSVIQAKLTVNQPGDIYEREADRMAAQVMAMPQSDRSIQREMEPKKEKEKIQMKPSLQLASDGNREAGGNLEGQLNSGEGGGSPLPDDVRSFMEPRFGADFSQVRVHTGSESVQMNQDLNAQAFTHRQDVYFGTGKSPAKDALTAHELTHVVQQRDIVQSELTRDSLKLQRECSSCEIEESTLQRQPAPTAPSISEQNTELGGLSVGNFDFHFKDCQIFIWAWVKFKFEKSITAKEQTTFKAKFFNAIHGKWENSGYSVTGTPNCPCSKIPIKIHAEESKNSFYHKLVDVERDERRESVISDMNLSLSTGDQTMAHEFGHVLGLYDEYNGGWIENKMFWHKNQPDDPDALMNSGKELRERYFEHYRKRVQQTAKNDCSYSISSPVPSP